MTEPAVVTENPVESRRTQLLDAAASVFAAKGFQRATMREVADEAGVAPGTIYLYFRGKRDLILGLADRIFGAAIDESLARFAHLDIEASIYTIMLEQIRFARRHRALLQALIPEIWIDAELQERFMEAIVAPLLATTSAYLKQREDRGEIRPYSPQTVVQAMAGALLLATILQMASDQAMLQARRDEDVVAEMASLFTHGLLADAARA